MPRWRLCAPWSTFGVGLREAGFGEGVVAAGDAPEVIRSAEQPFHVVADALQRRAEGAPPAAVRLRPDGAHRAARLDRASEQIGIEGTVRVTRVPSGMASISVSPPRRWAMSPPARWNAIGVPTWFAAVSSLVVRPPCERPMACARSPLRPGADLRSPRPTRCDVPWRRWHRASPQRAGRWRLRVPRRCAARRPRSPSGRSGGAASSADRIGAAHAGRGSPSATPARSHRSHTGRPPEACRAYPWAEAAQGAASALRSARTDRSSRFPSSQPKEPP